MTWKGNITLSCFDIGSEILWLQSNLFLEQIYVFNRFCEIRDWSWMTINRVLSFYIIDYNSNSIVFINLLIASVLCIPNASSLNLVSWQSWHSTAYPHHCSLISLAMPPRHSVVSIWVIPNGLMSTWYLEIFYSIVPLLCNALFVVYIVQMEVVDLWRLSARCNRNMFPWAIFHNTELFVDMTTLNH